MSVELPKVSIVTPAYGAEAYLERAMRSVLAQTDGRWEHLIIDDASKDRTFQVAMNVAAGDPRVRVMQQSTNQGPSAARNRALREARGSMVAYLDADDEIFPDYVANIVRLQGRGDVLIFTYDIHSELVGPRFGETWTHEPALHVGGLAHTNPFVPLAVAHERSVLDKVGFFDETRSYEEDWDMWKRMAAAGLRLQCFARKSGTYHARADSLARTKRTPDDVPGHPRRKPSR